MSKRAGRVDRRAGRNRAVGRDGVSLLEQLYVAAGLSLLLSHAEVADAMAALVDVGDPGNIADALRARALEMLELLPGISESVVSGITQAREQIERRRGAGFIGRVAAMGRPTTEAFSAEAFVAFNTDALAFHRIH